MFSSFKPIGSFLPCQPKIDAYSTLDVKGGSVYYEDLFDKKTLPTLSKRERSIFEWTKRVSDTCYWGRFVYGNYDKITELINKKLKTKISPEYLKKTINKIKRKALVKIEVTTYYDQESKIFRHECTKIIPNRDAKYRHKKRERGFRVRRTDLLKWNLTKARKYVQRSQTTIEDHLEPHTGHGSLFTRSENLFLTAIYTHLHSENALKDEKGIRYVTFSGASYSKLIEKSKSSVSRSSKHLSELGVINKEIIRNSKGVDCTKITINFSRLSELCNDPDIILLDPFVKEKTNLRLIYGKLRAQLEAGNASNLAGCRENDNPKVSHHIYSYTKDNIKGVPSTIEDWFTVDNSFVERAPSGKKYSEFDKEVFTEFVADQIYGDDAWSCDEAVEDFPPPDSRNESSWLAINFGVHALSFLGKKNFKCVGVANNVLAVKFDSGDERKNKCAQASLEKLRPNAKRISRDKFIALFRRRIRGQLRRKQLESRVPNPIENKDNDPMKRAVMALAKQKIKEQKAVLKRLEKENPHFKKALEEDLEN